MNSMNTPDGNNRAGDTPTPSSQVLFSPAMGSSGDGKHGNPVAPQQLAFSPNLLPSLPQLEDVPNLESFVLNQNNTHDVELWKDISSQAAWLANGDDDFSHLVAKNL
ncbi:unnamed protein product [Ambrosiozyma monospora]|uniref:Unnamed protein product n=1 Tax=Ambrosiozyma monospora TaxID=43982 RepID=A0ACB5SSB8_AMBMO|nr:unnamed protein product [Ambrosiozyma monospora]